MNASVEKVLINGEWKVSKGTSSFKPLSPLDGTETGEVYPISPWEELEESLKAGAQAALELKKIPAAKIAEFLNLYADNIEARREEIVAMANKETALPSSPRLNDVELPRTTGQLRQAAAAVLDKSWTLPVLDLQNNIRSYYRPLGGPVLVFGPNNFPLAFNGSCGGDFAAAIAAGNPVICKANSAHPGTTRIVTEEALKAMEKTGMPKALLQLIYRSPHDLGEKWVSHPLTAAIAYTGARDAGLVLKAAADKHGKPAYMELSSINPVVVLPGAIEERSDELAGEFSTSCLMGTGQFCTNPGLVLGIAGASLDGFLLTIKNNFETSPCGKLLTKGVLESLKTNVAKLAKAGAEILTGGKQAESEGFSYANTLLKVSGKRFLEDPEQFQLETFGNSSLVVAAESLEELAAVIASLEGNLTGCIYSAKNGADTEAYNFIAPGLQQKVGRLLNDKMPTGVAVSPAMNHGGPFPATGHPGFTAVGIPASLRRFCMLQSYDAVREERLPDELKNSNPLNIWRNIGSEWTKEPVTA